MIVRVDRRGLGRRGAARGGFTLVEILIAATVLGLGVLGIATLFAGAARQQQLAFDESSTQRVTNNIDALVADRFERFGGGSFVRDEAEAGNFPYFAPGQWHPVASAPYGGAAGQSLPGSLSLDRSDNGLADQTAYGLIRGQSLALYRAPWTSPDLVPNPTAAWNQPMRQDTFTMTPMDDPMPFTVSEMLTMSQEGALLRPAPTGRLHPGFTVEVRFAQEVEQIGATGPEWVFDDLGGSDGQVPVLALEYLDWDDLDAAQGNTELWPEQQTPPQPQTPASIEVVSASEGMGSPPTVMRGSLGAMSDSWLEFSVERPDQSDPPVSNLNAGQVVMPGYNSSGGRTLVREVRLVDPLYREDRLLSLDERIGYTRDEAFQGGRRPSRGVAQLFRRTLDGRDQLMSISYTLEPLGRVQYDPSTEIPFVPPDTYARLYDTTQMPANYGLLSQVTLTLGYDEARGYTLTAMAVQDEWALERGQILVVARAGMNPVDPQMADRTDPNDPGADFAVRVRRTLRVGGNLVGVLDDSPRQSLARGGPRSMLPDRMATVPVQVWALRDVVRSADGGDLDVDWRVRPTGARVVTLGGGR